MQTQIVSVDDEGPILQKALVVDYAHRVTLRRITSMNDEWSVGKKTQVVEYTR